MIVFDLLTLYFCCLMKKNSTVFTSLWLALPTVDVQRLSDFGSHVTSCNQAKKAALYSAGKCGGPEHRRDFFREILRVAYSRIRSLFQALSQWGRRERKRHAKMGGGREKGKGSFLTFYLRVRAFSIQRTRLSRSLEHATEYAMDFVAFWSAVLFFNGLRYIHCCKSYQPG